MTTDAAAPITVDDGVHAVGEFFQRLGALCAARDYDSAQALFAADVVSFGTRATVVQGLPALRAQQWEGIWGNIEDFQVRLDALHASSSGQLAWGMLPWTSTGFDADGAPFERPGRATVVLERRAGRWLAVHSHFSLAPGTPPRTFGRQPPG